MEVQIFSCRRIVGDYIIALRRFPLISFMFLCTTSVASVFVSHASYIGFSSDDYARLFSLLFREKCLGVFIFGVKGKNKDLANK